jgi:hypothetical protein
MIQDSAIVPGVRGISSFRGNGNLCLEMTCVHGFDSKIEAGEPESRKENRPAEGTGADGDTP